MKPLRVALGALGLGLLALLTFSPAPVLAGGVVGGGCTEADLDAKLAGGGSVTFNCGGPKTITVTTTKIISDNTSLDGGGVITISGGGTVRIFAVFPGVTLALDNIAISAGNGGGGEGGAIYNNGGALTITDSTFSNNSAVYGGAIFSVGGALTITNSTFSSNSVTGPFMVLFGGAIRNLGGLLAITNSTFSGNSAGSGGAISNDGGLLTIMNSRFSGNAAGFDGGVITSSTGVIVANSTFSGNSAGAGGAIHADGTLTVSNSTFSGNLASDEGGAIILTKNADPTLTVTITNSTFSGNSARSAGGAIENGVHGNQWGGPLNIINSTFSGNSATFLTGGAIENVGGAATVILQNTIVADSPAGGNCYGPITDAGHNLDSDGTCGVGPATDPMLDPGGLASNGGPTQTIALLPGSPAIDNGDQAICAAPPVSNLDQRRFVRPGQGSSNCCIGAYEFNGVPCGDGILAPGEQCDDGNAIDGDGCDSNCTFTGCGNGIVTAGEQCDDGNSNNNDACKNNCTANACGDGVVYTGVEQCDDGNPTDGDGCDSNCTFTGCGNGIVTVGEQCDDGNLVSGDGCSTTCAMEPGYTCTGAPSVCTVTTFCDGFGNGNAGWDVIGGFWTVDNGQYVGTGDGPHPIHESITLARDFQAADVRMSVDMTSLVRVDKGVVLRFQDSVNFIMLNFRASPYNDLFVHEVVAGGYIIHPPFPNPVLDSMGTPLHVEVELAGQHLSVSVNGTLAIDETFPLAISAGKVGLWAQDDQFGNGTTAFDNFRVEEAQLCGDGIVQACEQCDDGNRIDGDGCDSNCTLTGCGNGIVTAGEQCDDGNTVSGDGCDSNCTVTGCGNGAVAAGEQCDDGNAVSGDGCSSTCQIEPCYTCSGQPSACGPVVCTALDQCHVVGTCDPASGVCSNPEAADGTTCDAGSGCPPDTCEAGVCVQSGCANGGVAAGGTFTAGTLPVPTSVTSPVAGAVSIRETAASGAAPAGFEFVGRQVTVMAPAATASEPLKLVFTIPASLMPVGTDPMTIQVFKDGVLVEECSGTHGVASPDPCVSSRTPLPGGDVQITVLTSTASVWTFAVPVCGDGSLSVGEQCEDGNLTNGDGCNAACRYELIPGGASDNRACLVEWSVVNPNNVPKLDRRGHLNLVQRCKNNDPTCDFGTDPNACEFQVVVCVNNVDPNLGSCRQLGVADPVAIISPNRVRDAANYNRLVSALHHLRDPVTGQTDLTLPVPSSQTNLCSAPFPITVRARRWVALRTLSKSWLNSPVSMIDSDRLFLLCKP